MTDTPLLSFFHLLDSERVTAADRDTIFTLADIYRKRGRVHAPDAPCAGKILANMFCESSTRTRFSFDAAMLRLGGHVITLESGANSSQNKGETHEDTGRVMGAYADIVVFRHPEPGSTERFSRFAPVPVINGGDGANQHPTQSLIDLYHLHVTKGTVTGLHIVFMGDLRYSRTVFPLLEQLVKLGNRVTLIAPPELELPPQRQALLGTGATSANIHAIADVLKDADAMYVTRIQKERLPATSSAQNLDDMYRVTPKMLCGAPQHLQVMHPLPRVGEISPAIDDTPRAGYFVQAENGLYVRMALLHLMTTGT